MLNPIEILQNLYSKATSTTGACKLLHAQRKLRKVMAKEAAAAAAAAALPAAA